MKPIFRLLLAACIIAFAASMLAVSCGKTAGGNNNNNSGNNSGNGGNGDGNGGSGGCTGICPTTNLTLSVLPVSAGYVKASGNTVTINAAGLAGAITPHSDADNDNRGYEDASSASAAVNVFNIDYPDTLKAVLFFVSRAHVTKDTIAMPAAAATATGVRAKCTSSESGDEALARAVGGAHCRTHHAGNNILYFDSYLGTVFNNTKTASHARGLMRCGFPLKKENTRTGSNDPITDTLTFDDTRMDCYLAVVNSAGGAATAEIDDVWVTDSGSTSEVELYAIGIDVDGKTIPQWSDETGYGLTEFKKAHDNAKFKRLLQNNEWADLKFKVKIVTAANF